MVISSFFISWIIFIFVLEYSPCKSKGINMNNDLKIIKKYYGENMMHLCRELFPTILETEGLLSKIMLDTFAPNRFLYDDIKENKKTEAFKNYIYKLSNLSDKEIVKTNKTPEELLDEAGYYLYECKTEKDIQYFKKYYETKEELCTFNGGRLDYCHVFFAVKKDIDNIKRKDFKNPKRDDEYGTSVISIQFTKVNNTLSIKNRYNHTVSNPDATFSNNLENIIEGLTESFEKKYDLNINQNTSKDFELKNYVKANDGKYYKYNYEEDNIYYCPSNIIIDNFEVKQLEKEKYILLDYFILDLVHKKIYLYDEGIEDSFVDGLKNIKKINIIKLPNTEEKEIELILEEGNRVIIKIDKVNEIIEYTNNNLTEIGNYFLYFNNHLKRIDLSNLEYCGNYFLHDNIALESAHLPKLKEVGNYFLQNHQNLKNLYAFELRKVGNGFLERNVNLYEIVAPKLKEVGDDFFSQNIYLTGFNAPKLEKIGDYFLNDNNILNYINLPCVKTIGTCFLCNNSALKDICLPKVETVGNSFMYFNTELKSVTFPKLKKIGNEFLGKNTSLDVINFPSVIEIGHHFLYNNENLREIYLPQIKFIGEFFLYRAKKIKTLEFSKLRIFGECVLMHNKSKIKLYAPKLKTTIYNPKIKKVDNLYELNETSIQKFKRVFSVESSKQKVKTKY